VEVRPGAFERRAEWSEILNREQSEKSDQQRWRLVNRESARAVMY
jgi:hypothetical protein